MRYYQFFWISKALVFWYTAYIDNRECRFHLQFQPTLILVWREHDSKKTLTPWPWALSFNSFFCFHWQSCTSRVRGEGGGGVRSPIFSIYIQNFMILMLQKFISTVPTPTPPLSRPWTYMFHSLNKVLPSLVIVHCYTHIIHLSSVILLHKRQ